jgi:hypothetical protein
MQRYLAKTSGALRIMAASGILLLWSAVSFAGTPILGTDCGSTATIIGSDAAGKVTLGTPDPLIPATGTCTLTFSVPYTNPPACAATNETNGGGFPTPMGTRTTNSTLVIGSSTGSPSGDVVSYACQDY